MSTRKKKNGIAVSSGTVENLAVTRPGRKKTTAPTHEQMDVPSSPRIRIPLEKIDFSPFNHRKFIHPRKLEELSASIAKLDVIEEITVRITVPGRFELATGERRVRAARIAGLIDIPANIRELTDEQVIEMQLAENFERQDPHFMEEAYGIDRWVKLHRPLKDVAARMGRPDKYVYDRVKLLDLVEPIHEMAMADCFTFSECLAIAGISQDAQQNFYDTHCQSWKDTPHFKVNRLDFILSSYHCRLSAAKFDIRDETLMPAMGACITCSHNTGCITSMFPEEETTAKCTKRSCFAEKTKASFFRSVADFVDQNNITAFLAQAEPAGLEKDAVDYLAAHNKPLAVVESSSVTEVLVPKEPVKELFMKRTTGDQYPDEYFEEEEDYSGEGGSVNDDENGFSDEEDEPDEEEQYSEEIEYDEEEEQQPQGSDTADPELEDSANTESAPLIFNEKAYDDAMGRYRERQADHEKLIAEFPLQFGLRIGYNQSLILVTFINRPRPAAVNARNEAVQLTSKEVQEAIKQGKATPAMLDGELKRSQQWIVRKEEIDAEKTQKTIYDQFKHRMTEDAPSTTLTDADIVGRRWFMYQGLSYSDQGQVDALLFPGLDQMRREGPSIEDFKKLTDDQEGILIKFAVMGRDQTKIPTEVAGQVLYQMAQPWVNVAAVETKYQAGAEKRRSNHRDRTRKLQTIIAELDPDRPKVLPAWATSLAVSDCTTMEDFLQKYLIPDAFSSAGEDVRERALYAARQEQKVHGFASIDPTKSSTGKMVVFIPNK
ncbi:MAG TPA: ParB/RepB/Spo0J family partition protein [Puia sp.]|uniref:ParB/RepB/Spo0J family partition protein n=1 Tax=Puia sp. TaxID=2045100 RepID=UPI002BE751D8|nr:ParB/RepB/Spo0J family partition protein [Puia sp.]HVU97725.1 ParB/RepB/Spo0J family partition protein [Puia sp.]